MKIGECGIGYTLWCNNCANLPLHFVYGDIFAIVDLISQRSFPIFSVQSGDIRELVWCLSWIISNRLIPSFPLLNFIRRSKALSVFYEGGNKSVKSSVHTSMEVHIHMFAFIPLPIL